MDCASRADCSITAGCEVTPLLDNPKDSSTKKLSTRHKLLPHLILLTCTVCFALGFNFSITGALTVALSQRFNVSLDEASWSTSVNTVCFLMTSMC